MKRQIIDFHTHTFPEKIAKSTIDMLASNAHIEAHTDGTRQGLLDSMDRAGVSLSVILPVVTRPEQFQTVNNFAAKINEKYEGKLLSFGGIHPLSQQYKKELDYIKALGLKGIKLHPDYQGEMIDHIGYKHIIDYASELGLIIVTHAGIDVGLPGQVKCPPDRARKVIDELQPPAFVLAHTGGWKMWDDVEKNLVGCDVYFDMAFSSEYLKKEQFERIARNHGTDKILFATDSPWEDPRDGIAYLESTSLSEEEKNKIFTQNACNLLHITL